MSVFTRIRNRRQARSLYTVSTVTYAGTMTTTAPMADTDAAEIAMWHAANPAIRTVAMFDYRGHAVAIWQ